MVKSTITKEAAFCARSDYSDLNILQKLTCGRFDNSFTALDATLARHEADQSKWAKTGDERWKEMLEKQEGVYESREWFAGERGNERTLGEDTDNSQSRAIVDKFYKAGAATVWVFDINEQDQNSGNLLIELPDDPAKRAAVLKVCGRWARKGGFRPDKDKGQRYALVMLD